MSRKLLFVVAGIALLALLGACASDSQPAGQATTPAPTETTFTEAEWTITTPAGWTREDITSNADAKKAVRYNDADGGYFIVAIDPLGSDFAYDALWRYEAKGTSFEIVDKYECKGKNDESCRENDQRYDGYILWKSGAEPPKVGGHTWYFIFGNTTTATLDVAQFEAIAESVRVTS